MVLTITYYVRVWGLLGLFGFSFLLAHKGLIRKTAASRSLALAITTHHKEA